VININGLDGLHKIVVVNPKGGCGKTTLATNLASACAQRGSTPTLVDCDPLGFSMRWLEKRPATRPVVHGIEAYASDRPIAAQVNPESDTLIFDLPAALLNEHLQDFTYTADSILIPIMPSAVDVSSAARFIGELLLDQQLDRREQRLTIVANRVRSNTKSFQMLKSFLTSLDIPLIAVLRDSQNFVHAIAQGLGICELPAYRIKNDIQQIDAIFAWLGRQRSKVRIFPSTEQRQEMIAEIAFRRAQDRGFQGGDPETDWIEAERELNESLMSTMSG
jgi:chromosome partitioning protein